MSSMLCDLPVHTIYEKRGKGNMPLVFIHGVANRGGPKYDAGVKARDALFRQFLLGSHRRSDGTAVQIVNPYWGHLGGRLRWNGASLPAGDNVEKLGSEKEALAELYASALLMGDFEPSDHAILPVARRSLSDAVDLLWAASVIDADPDDFDEVDDFAALGAFAYAYASANPSPDWLAAVADDDDLLDRLEIEVATYASRKHADNTETLGLGSKVKGVWGTIRAGATKLKTAATGGVGRKASDLIRPAFVPGVVGFLGDVFVYLHQQNSAGSIREEVSKAIKSAAASVEEDDRLVIVAHSMGGNIVYDLLTSDLTTTQVPLLITAGTQVGFFEELKLFAKSDEAVPTKSRPKVEMPSNIERWINVFDYSDLLGFRVAPIIDGVEDFDFPTGSLLNAHGQYFLQPGFHQRLAARVLSKS
ncbi:hypothetical protein [Mycobacterium mantenii]|uniref:hypothetical protein n=1 Tax=Mycobacterium mantenii TaxID=560555 RepID=UPI0010427BD6|nr:hypothetical protein [Mycobacterium mantenii]